MTPYQSNFKRFGRRDFFLTPSWSCLGVLLCLLSNRAIFREVSAGERVCQPARKPSTGSGAPAGASASFVFFCQGNGLSLTKGRARNNIQWASPASSVHVSPVFTLWKHGSVYPNSRSLSRAAKRLSAKPRVGRHSIRHSTQGMGLVAPADAIELPFQQDNL